MNIFKKRKEPQGIIKYYNLSDFWMDCTEEEKKALNEYHSKGIGLSPRPLDEGNITSMGGSKYTFIYAMIGHAISNKNYTLGKKIIAEGTKEEPMEHELVDYHFFLQEAAEFYYKQKDTDEDALFLAEKFCEKDVSLFPRYSKQMISEYGSLPRLVTFQRLAMIYEKQGRIEDAIKICEYAIDNELSDSTKGGFSARLEKLKKKL